MEAELATTDFAKDFKAAFERSITSLTNNSFDLVEAVLTTRTEQNIKDLVQVCISNQGK